jgi:hypothetical protein
MNFFAISNYEKSIKDELIIAIQLFPHPYHLRPSSIFLTIAIAKFKGFFNFVILYLKGEKRK